MSAIAKNEAKLCIKGKKNFFDVPEKYQADAREYIEAEGYIINEDGTVSKALDERSE